MFARKKRTTVPVSDCKFKPVVSVTVPIIMRSFDVLCHEEFKASHTCETVHAVVDDIHLLLMQKDFESRYPLEYRNFVDSMSLSSKSTLVKSKLPKMSDEQLMSYIKSRHIQQPSELRAWYNYLSSQYDIELDAYNKAQKDAYNKAQKDASDSAVSSASASTESSTPSPTSESTSK